MVAHPIKTFELLMLISCMQMKRGGVYGTTHMLFIIKIYVVVK